MSAIQFVKRFINLTSVAVILTGAGSMAITGIAKAAVINPAPAAKISFTFDDGLASAYTQAAPTLKKYGLTGTDYVPTGCVGMTSVPNNCHANTDDVYLSWSQVTALQNSFGWEIGAHTVTHPYLATFDATDGQPKPLTNQQVVSELTDSKKTLADHGINATAFATPYGDYNMYTLQQIAKLYTSHRGFADQGMNGWPNNDLLLYDFQVQAGVSVTTVKSKIDQAIANKQWLILTLHDIKTSPSTNPDDYEYSTANLDKIAAYVKTKISAGVLQNTNISNGLTTGASTDNLLPGGTFDSGISGGWTTSSPTTVTKDTANNGSFPSATNSIKFSPSSSASRLFSPRVPVSSNTTYLLRNYLANASKTGNGQMEFYIDEYDINGNWISGQFKKAEASVYTEDLNFTYTPTSAAVAKASLQITNTAGSGITAYLDNSQWMALSSTSATTGPAQTNLVANGTFDAGLGTWTTDGATSFTADNASHGSPNNVVNSVKLTAGTTSTHLFSPKVSVTPIKSYDLTSYANLLTLTAGSGGELGFYIDEYDSGGNWVSGQYKYGMRTTGSGNVEFKYTPSSSSVASASLQVILVGGSGITGYFDDVRWYAI